MNNKFYHIRRHKARAPGVIVFILLAPFVSGLCLCPNLQLALTLLTVGISTLPSKMMVRVQVCYPVLTWRVCVCYLCLIVTFLAVCVSLLLRADT